MNLQKALQVFLRNEEVIEWEVDSNEVIAKKAVYNSALRDVDEFIYQFLKGDVNSEFLRALEERQNGEE